jgi:hypothetical protein
MSTKIEVVRYIIVQLLFTKTMKLILSTILVTFSLSVGAVHLDEKDFTAVVYKLQPKLQTSTQPKKKLKIVKSFFQPKIHFGVDDDDNELDEELALQVFYRNPELVHPNDCDDVELSDKVKFRLWLARQLALKKYQEVWG